jgi:hypothetical protein
MAPPSFTSTGGFHSGVQPRGLLDSRHPPGHHACRSHRGGNQSAGPDSHKRFREKHGLPFTLLSDENKEVVKLFGVNGPLGFWVQRVTFLIDQNRTVRGRVKAHFSIAEHEAFIREAIELQKN